MPQRYWKYLGVDHRSKKRMVAGNITGTLVKNWFHRPVDVPHPERHMRLLWWIYPPAVDAGIPQRSREKSLQLERTLKRKIV